MNNASQQPTALTVFQNFAVDKPSPFDVNKLADKFRYRNTGWSIPEAYLCLLFKTAMVDGTFDLKEETTIRNIVARSRAMGALSPADLAKTNDTVNQRMAQNPNAITEAAQTLPAEMCLPVFAHCVDITLADGQLLQQEAKFLEELITLLDIEPDNARRVMEVLLLKAQY